MKKIFASVATLAALGMYCGAAYADDTATSNIDLKVQAANYCSGLNMPTQLNMSATVNGDNTVTSSSFQLGGAGSIVTCTALNAKVSLKSANQGLINGEDPDPLSGFTGKLHYTANALWTPLGETVALDTATTPGGYAVSTASIGPASGEFTLTITTQVPENNMKLMGGTAYQDTLTVKVGPQA
jgi:hypothetical protein